MLSHSLVLHCTICFSPENKALPYSKGTVTCLCILSSKSLGLTSCSWLFIWSIVCLSSSSLACRAAKRSASKRSASSWARLLSSSSWMALWIWSESSGNRWINMVSPQAWSKRKDYRQSQVTAEVMTSTLLQLVIPFHCAPPSNNLHNASSNWIQ